MINISLFKFGTKALEIVIIDNAPWFNASQVAKALGYTNPSKAIQDNVSGKYNQQLDLGRPGKKPVCIAIVSAILICKKLIPKISLMDFGEIRFTLSNG